MIEVRKRRLLNLFTSFGLVSVQRLSYESEKAILESIDCCVLSALNIDMERPEELFYFFSRFSGAR